MKKILILLLAFICVSDARIGSRPIYHSYTRPMSRPIHKSTPIHQPKPVHKPKPVSRPVKPVVYHEHRPVYHQNYTYGYTFGMPNYFWPTLLIVHSMNHANQTQTIYVKEKPKNFSLTVCKTNNQMDCDYFFNPEYELYNDEVIVKTKNGNRVYNSSDYNIKIEER